MVKCWRKEQAQVSTIVAINLLCSFFVFVFMCVLYFVRLTVVMGTLILLLDVERMMLWAITQANGIAYSRYPAAHVHVIKNPTSSSLDRLVYARLSPSHTDERSSVLAANPLLNLLTPEALADFFAEAPPTDQLTFERYLHHEVPKFAKFRKEVDYRAGVAAPTGELMDRGKLEPKNAGIVTSKDGGEKSGLGRTLSGLMTALFGKGGVALGTTQESDSENI